MAAPSTHQSGPSNPTADSHLASGPQSHTVPSSPSFSLPSSINIGIPSSSSTRTDHHADPITRGLEAVLAPTVQGTAERLYTVQQSQLAVGAELERLVFQLQQYLETSDPPQSQIKTSIDRMASLAKRLDNVNESFTRIQARLERILNALLEERRRQGQGG